jgi:hypothetical protein
MEEIASSAHVFFFLQPGCKLRFLFKAKTLPGWLYAGQGRRSVLTSAGNAGQDSRRNHRAAESIA